MERDCDYDEIFPGLYIGAQSCTMKPEKLQESNITRILSIGCRSFTSASDDRFKISSYPDVIDQPEVNIFPFLKLWDDVICSAMACNESILVHCVYGQSRSVSAVLYHLMMHMNHSLLSAYDLIKIRRPCICTNPGFLCQLAVIDKFHAIPFYTPTMNFTPEATLSGSNLSSDAETIVQLSMQAAKCSSPSCAIRIANMKCNTCQQHLHTTAIVDVGPESNDEFNIDYDYILQRIGDAFWCGYKPLHSKAQITAALTWSSPELVNTLLVDGAPWMIEQLSSSKISCVDNKESMSKDNDPIDVGNRGVDSKRRKLTAESTKGLSTKTITKAPVVYLKCPQCRKVVGFMRKQGLLLCNGFLLLDLYTLYQDRCVYT